MKQIALVSLLFICALVVDAGVREVPFIVGPQLFRAGDRIRIESVKASSSSLELGERVTVSGTYTLKSHPAAKISVFVTQIERAGSSRVSSEQALMIKEGTGRFELSLEIRHEGYLHVSFYPIAKGKGFGGVYFGNSKQMQEIEDWTLDWYLGDSM